MIETGSLASKETQLQGLGTLRGAEVIARILSNCHVRILLIHAVHFSSPSTKLAMLRSHGVAHVFNSWTRMPPVLEQLAINGSDETADFTVSRFLLKPGCSYEEAVKAFQPYSEIQIPAEEAKTAAGIILRRSLEKARKGYIYVNNRLEGCAPLTINDLLEKILTINTSDKPQRIVIKNF